MSSSQGKVRFRRFMDLGSADAEQDRLLQNAFLNTGELDVLRNTRNPRSVVVGRTGAGKTALLRRVEGLEQHTIRIQPEALSLQFLSNTTILPYLSELGVHLEPFYRLLWKHVFIVELLAARFELKDEETQTSLFQWMSSLWKKQDKRKEQALKYLQEWGSRFWLESEYRVKELTQTLEQQLEAQAGIDTAGIKANAGGKQSEKTEVSQEILNKVQNVINNIQYQALVDAFSIVREDILDDPAVQYFILIDDLDKNWVEKAFAYDLIDALLSVVGEFAQMDRIKIAVALRENILEKLYLHTAGQPGAQREKYETLLLRLKWSQHQLVSMINERMQELTRAAFGVTVGINDILPKKRLNVGRNVVTIGPRAIDYLLSRTFMRPRDLISFLNLCITRAEGRDKIGWPHILAAETEYSQGRLRSLVDEWSENYPGVEVLFQAFKEMPDPFHIEDALREEVIYKVLLRADESNGRDAFVPAKLLERAGVLKLNDREILEEIISILYRVGFFGVRMSPADPVTYSYESLYLLENGMQEHSTVHFHPAVHKALGIRPAA